MMNKDFFWFYLFFVTSINVFSQNNLIKNPSFEEYYACPSQLGQLELSKYWVNPNKDISTPGNPLTVSEYFNRCSSNSNVSVPENLWNSYQEPKDGEAYIGLSMYHRVFYPQNTWEFVEGELKDILIKNKKYCITLYISLSNNSALALNEIHLLFSSDTLRRNDGLCFCSYNPNIIFKSDSCFSDTLNWIKLEAKYYASGGEQYIYIGNFLIDSLVNYCLLDQQSNNLFAYYYIDNVWLYECEEDSIPTEPPPASDSSLHYKVPNVISPNGDGLNDAFVLESRGVKEASVIVYNRWGEEVVRHKVSGISTDIVNKTILWDATHKGQSAPQGVYYYLIELSTKNGEVIIEKGTVTVL